MLADTTAAYEQLREHVASLVVDDDLETVDLTREMAIDCPDCGRQIAFEGKCPKCAGRSWAPAGKRSEESRNG